MKIYSDGKSRVLNGAFPKHFRLLNGEKEVPFIRTGRESIRISGELPVGDLLVDEIIRQKVAQPAKLDAQSIAIINKQDFDRIDILNKKLAINQEKMGEQMNALAEHEATLANLETKNAGDIELLSGQTASAVQMLKGAIEDTEKKNVAVQKALSQAIKETGEDLSDSLVAHETAKNPHRITKATVGLDKVENISPKDMPVSNATQEALDKKADKKAIDEVEKKLTAKSDGIIKGIERMNLIGGVGGNELPVGGKKGYVLAKKSNKTGDYEWKAGGGGGVSIHNDLDGRSASDCHPISSITNLSTTLSTETTNRENADIGLQGQIDAITASSDVKDIVGTYAELQAYDTSTLGNNDIIKVLQDETQNDATTYYRWNTTTQTFTLIGQEGPYYTKSEADSEFVPQTRTVNGKALSTDISLDYTDVGAQVAGNYVTTDTAQSITAQKTFETSTWNGGVRIKRTSTSGAFMVFENSNGVIGGIGMSGDTKPLWASSDASQLKAIVRSGNNSNSSTGSTTQPVYIDTSGVAQEITDMATTDTAQTISGQKTFTTTAWNGGPIIKRLNSNSAFIMYANNDGTLGGVGLGANKIPTWINADATVNRALVMSGTNASPGTGSSTQPIYVDSSGIAQAITDMATTDTTQTISGTKTFTARPVISTSQNDKMYIKDGRQDKSAAPNSQYSNTLLFQDKNNKTTGYLTCQQLSGGDIRTAVNAQNFETGTTTNVSGIISVTAKKDGTIETYAPTPPTNDDSTQIATTEWVKDQSYITGITSSDVTTALGYTPADDIGVVHLAGSETITGAKTFKEAVTIQNGAGTGALTFGADVNASTITNNTRKLGQINSPSYQSGSKPTATLLGWDTQGDTGQDGMHTANKATDVVAFGGMKKITTNTSPMNIVFCVTKTRGSSAAADKIYPLEMDANEARFNVQPNYNGTNLATVNDIPSIPVTDVTQNGTSVLNGTVAEVTVPTQASDIGALPSSTTASDIGGANKDLSNLTTTGKSYGAKLSMPSSSYDDLTLGSSGTTYTASANGYFLVGKASTATGQYINLQGTVRSALNVSASGQTPYVSIPCRKGEVITISYNLGGNTAVFRFIYAEGEV